MIIDPLEINNEWFKAVIDKIHHGLEYSYIVYNKSFEASRLKEMAEFINLVNNIKCSCIWCF
ncbi:conserved hypothetical protein [Ureaplasma parvum serovar 14 str. ATCC 33697]|nr:conserved hypothetical protein [Ureaplasma parvum serovar 14 str. ATCC 33697]